MCVCVFVCSRACVSLWRPAGPTLGGALLQDPDQDTIYSQGNAYLQANYPKLTYIRGTKVVVTE